MALLATGQRVARYTILGKIATGGMSEVYLAQQDGPAGFTKIVVLKVILPNLAEDEQFLVMFRNEAKLAALLNHPNVIQIFDFGVDGAVHYMAMEYVDGRHLGHIARAAAERNELIPVPIVLRLIADACGGLEYAHSLTGADGHPLEIIHRDVSLENIMVTYAGLVKLVDFGVAKARNLESYTTQGTLKGKYNYMSPEMIEGVDKLDCRADLFSMGIVLYRLITGRLPFDGDNHAQLIHRIISDEPVPPRQIVPEIPEALEQIMMRGLHKDRRERYQTAAELQGDLERLQESQGFAVLPSHINQYLSSLFPAGSDPDRQLYQQVAGRATPPVTGVARKFPTGQLPLREQRALVAEVESAGRSGQSTETATPIMTPRRLDGAGLNGGGLSGDAVVDEVALAPADLIDDIEDTSPLRPPTSTQPSPSPGNAAKPRSQHGLKLVLLGVAVVLLGAATAFLIRIFVAPPSDPFGDELAGIAHDAEGWASGAQQHQLPQVSSLSVDARVQVDRGAIAADAGVVVDTLATVVDAAPPQVDLALRTKTTPTTTRRKDPPPPAQAFLTIQAPDSKDVRIALNGRAFSGPLDKKLALGPGTYHVSAKSASEHYAVVKKVILKNGATETVNLQPQRGKLLVKVQPWAEVKIDGKLVGTTPLAAIPLWEGPHEVVLSNSDLKANQRIRVTIRAGEQEELKVRLTGP